MAQLSDGRLVLAASLESAGVIVIELRGSERGMTKERRDHRSMLRVNCGDGRSGAVAKQVWIDANASQPLCQPADAPRHTTESEGPARPVDPNMVEGATREQQRAMPLKVLGQPRA